MPPPPFSAAAGRPSRVTLEECRAEAEEGELQLLSLLPQPKAGMHRGAGTDIVRQRGEGGGGGGGGSEPPLPRHIPSTVCQLADRRSGGGGGGDEASRRLVFIVQHLQQRQTAEDQPEPRVQGRRRLRNLLLSPSKVDTALGKRSPSRAKGNI